MSNEEEINKDVGKVSAVCGFFDQFYSCFTDCIFGMTAKPNIISIYNYVTQAELYFKNEVN